MLSTALPEPAGKSATKSRFPSRGVSRLDGAGGAIAPLLQRAELLKDKGQWEEAVAVCTDAIRRVPSSALPYALLGDIYLAQGKTGDASHWYRMSLERDPAQEAVASKHKGLLAQQRAVATGDYSLSRLANAHGAISDHGDNRRFEKTLTLPPVGVPPLKTKAPFAPERTTAERTLDWFDGVFPPGRSEGVTRLLLAATGIFVGMVLVIGTFLLLSLRKGDSSDDLSTAVVSKERVHQAAPLLASSTNAPLTPQRPDAAQSIPSHPVPRASLLKTLAAINDDELTMTAAQTDSEENQVQLEIALPSHASEGRLMTRNRVLQASAKAAQAAYMAIPRLQRFSIRVLIRSSRDTGSADAVNATLVFVGETSCVALRTLSTTSPVPDYALLTALFTNPWWSNNLVGP